MRCASLNLVDLAGSESVRYTGATGQRAKEGGKINQSLLTLSRVTNTLLGAPPSPPLLQAQRVRRKRNSSRLAAVAMKHTQHLFSAPSPAAPKCALSSPPPRSFLLCLNLSPPLFPALSLSVCLSPGELLPQVIQQLGDRSTSHINFRDSKLTRLMQPMLLGNAAMAMICCVTPAEQYTEETRSTLQFAARAKRVR